MRFLFVLGALAVVGCSGGSPSALTAFETMSAEDSGVDKATDIGEDAGAGEDAREPAKTPAIAERDAGTKADTGSGGGYVGPTDPTLPKSDAGEPTPPTPGTDAGPPAACIVNTNCVALGASSACGGDAVPWKSYQCAGGAEIAKAAGCMPQDGNIHFCCDPTLWCP